MSAEFDKALRNLLIVPLLIIGFTGTMIVGTYLNEKSHHCTVTGRSEPNFFHRYTFEATCTDGMIFSMVTGSERYQCARVGDNVTVKTYGIFWAATITWDEQC